MIIVQSTLLGALAKGIGRLDRKDRNIDRLTTKVIKSPFLFMSLWLIPGVIHHVIFNYLIKIGPIMYFTAGVLFTLALEVYLILLLLDANENEYRDYTKSYHPLKQESIDKKLSHLKQVVEKNNLRELKKDKDFCQICAKQIKDDVSQYSLIDQSDIE